MGWDAGGIGLLQDGWNTCTILLLQFYYTIEPVKDTFRTSNFGHDRS